MKLRLLVGVFLTLACLLNGQAVAGRLEGCPDISLLAKALAELRQSNWWDVSLARIQTIWPTEVLGIDCDSNACSSAGSKGRIINGRYECNETFFFDVKRNADGTWKTELKNLVIHYSAHKRKEIVAAARTLASASGLSGSEAATIGRDPRQDFHWENAAGDILSGLNVEFNQRETVWTVGFNLSRFPK